MMIVVCVKDTTGFTRVGGRFSRASLLWEKIIAHWNCAINSRTVFAITYKYL